MHVNSGYLADALPVVRNHVRAFADADIIVAPSGSCVASVRHQQPMVARAGGDTGLETEAVSVGERTLERSQLLSDVLGVTSAAELGSWFPHTVTYHPSCHGSRLLRLGDRQLDLIRTVDGIDVRPLPDAAECCSNVTRAPATRAGSGADICTGGDTACLLHLGGAMEKRGVGKQTLHFAEILASTKEEPWAAPSN